MRSRQPDQQGYVERAGVRVYYEAFGAGEPAVFLLPTWSIMHSRHWKAQIHTLARYNRVITFDPRGNGLSDRPTEPAAYADEEFVADALAVLDAVEVEQSIVVGFSAGCFQALILAGNYPERTLRIACLQRRSCLRRVRCRHRQRDSHRAGLRRRRPAPRGHGRNREVRGIRETRGGVRPRVQAPTPLDKVLLSELANEKAGC